MNKREEGFHYEKIAGVYLEEQGYQIIEYNFYCRQGEIDIIAMDGDTLVFVEVKYRRDERKGHPLDAISDTKRRRICQSALYYMKRQRIWNRPIRFDVVRILGQKIMLIKNAFEYIE